VARNYQSTGYVSHLIRPDGRCYCGAMPGKLWIEGRHGLIDCWRCEQIWAKAMGKVAKAHVQFMKAIAPPQHLEVHDGG
jgi:hypothetical protein